jgi:hypothetical protein
MLARASPSAGSSVLTRSVALVGPASILSPFPWRPVDHFVFMSASKSHIAKMQRSQSKILRVITNAPWYVTNQTLHDDLKVPFIKGVIQEKV